MSHTNFTRSFESGRRQDNVKPRFFMEAVEDPIAGARAGHPIFRDVEHVEIFLPGNPHTRPVQEVREDHKRRWPQEYEAFKKGHEWAIVGTPIEQWSMLTRGMVAELKALGIHTVEQCASLDDNAIQRIRMGGRRLKDLAAAYMDEAAAAAMLSEKTRENEILRADMEGLKAQLKELSEASTRMHAEMMRRGDAPTAAQTYVPGHHDPAEAARMAQGLATPAESALASLPEPRRRGRPPNSEREEAAA